MKEVAFVEVGNNYNPQHEVVWSYDYSLDTVGDSNSQYALGSFLLIEGNSYVAEYEYNLKISSSGADPLSGTILSDESGIFLISEDGDSYLTPEESNLGSDDVTNPFLSIIIDSTGWNALSSASRDGVSNGDQIPNSIVIRNSEDSLVYYAALTSIDPDFEFNTSETQFKSFRFALTDKASTLRIDHGVGNEYTSLTTIDLGVDLLSSTSCVHGFAYTSPVWDAGTNPVPLKMKNLHLYGNSSEYTTVTSEFDPLTSEGGNYSYTYVDNVSANR